MKTSTRNWLSALGIAGWVGVFLSAQALADGQTAIVDGSLNTRPFYGTGSGAVPLPVTGPGGAGIPVVAGGSAVAGDVAITTGGTAQNLFSGTTPVDGWAVYNPNATDTLWCSDSTTAAANGLGSIPILPNGGYETPPFYKPSHAVSCVAATTGDKITARRW